MTKRTALWVLVGLGLAVGIAIAGDDEKTTLDQIPAAAKAALLKLAGNNPIVEVEQEKERGTVTFEAEWAVNDKEAGAEVTADGDLIKMEQEITADALPAMVKVVVAKEFQGITDIKYEKVTVVMYEIEAKIDGKEKEILVSATGKMAKHQKSDGDKHGDGDDDDDGEDEAEVSLDQVPAAVKATILAEAKGAEIKEVERENENGNTVFEAEWEEGGQEVEVQVAPDGKLLKKEVSGDDDDDDDDDDK